ncbi:MAG: TIGR01777 family oxidoreductase [bacterium]
MPSKLKIALAGSSGLIGSTLVDHFANSGHDLTLLLRRPPPEPLPHRYLLWRPGDSMLESAALDGHDIVINLGGVNLAAGRWSQSRKELLRNSRIDSTQLLANSIASLERPPQLFISASAVGIYGNRPPQEEITESTRPGEGFLADLCRDWEAACQPAVDAGIRTINLRFGVVLSTRGGALAKLLPFFRIGLGGRSGSGRQMMSWIALAEIRSLVDHLIKTDSLHGPVNAVSPNPISNREFTKILANLLRRPALFFQPAWLLKLLFGQMAEETILAGARVMPEKLTNSGYQFRTPDLREALESVLQE